MTIYVCTVGKTLLYGVQAQAHCLLSQIICDVQHFGKVLRVLIFVLSRIRLPVHLSAFVLLFGDASQAIKHGHFACL